MFSHCATRLRFNLKNDQLAKTETLRQTSDVISIVEKGGQYQIVLGTKVEKVYEELTNLLGRADTREKAIVNLELISLPLFQEYLPQFYQPLLDRVVSKNCHIAIGITEDGDREIIGFMIQNEESNDTWSIFFEYLKERGLKGIELVISDAHKGLVSAIRKSFTNAS